MKYPLSTFICTGVHRWHGINNFCKTRLCESNSVSYWTGEGGGERLAFRHVKPCDDVGDVCRTVLFLNGLLSNMSGTKCSALQNYCSHKGINFLCFDYRGHGQSSGHFIDCTMHDWIADASYMLDHALSLGKEQNQQSNVILVGSSLGAWISLILAMRRPEVITAVIGIGSAINYTCGVYNEKLTYEQRSIWENPMETSSTLNIFQVSSPYMDDAYPFTRKLYLSGNDYLIQDRQYSNGIANRELSCPVRFIHGDQDDVVDYTKVFGVADILRSKYSGTDIKIQLLKGGDHRLSTADDISSILHALDEFV